MGSVTIWALGLIQVAVSAACVIYAVGRRTVLSYILAATSVLTLCADAARTWFAITTPPSQQMMGTSRLLSGVGLAFYAAFAAALVAVLLVESRRPAA